MYKQISTRGNNTISIYNPLLVYHYLEGVLQIDDPRNVSFSQYISFCDDMCNLILKQHFCFLHFLHCYDLPIQLAFAYPHLSKCTFACRGKKKSKQNKFNEICMGLNYSLLPMILSGSKSFVVIF